MMTFKTFLTENLETKMPILVKQFGPFLKSWWFTDRPPESIIRDIASADPTLPRADYITWILRMIKNKSLRGLEDMDKTYQRLKEFEQLKRAPNFTASRDINAYQSFGQLAKVLDDNKEVKSKGELVRLSQVQGVKKLSEQKLWTMYLVNTPEAASKLFRNTDWCVKDSRTWSQYPDKNFYYITWQGLQDPSAPYEEPMWLANFGSTQFKDSHDQAFSLESTDHLQKEIITDILLNFFRPLPEYQKMKHDIENYSDHNPLLKINSEADQYCNASYAHAEAIEEDPDSETIKEQIMEMDNMNEWIHENVVLDPNGYIIPPNDFYPLLIEDGVQLDEIVRTGVDDDEYLDRFYHYCKEWIKQI